MLQIIALLYDIPTNMDSLTDATGYSTLCITNGTYHHDDVSESWALIAYSAH